MDITFTSFLLFVLGVTGAIAAIWPCELTNFFSRFGRWQRRYKVNIASLICLVVATFWWLDITSAPAHAQFFIKTENWLRGAFPIDGGTGGAGAGGTDIYSVVFNTLRAIFVWVTPLEDEFQFVSMLRIDLGGKRVGAYLLKKGENNYIIQFGFECKGIHSTLRYEQVEPTFDLLEAGLKDLPENERLTIHLGSFTSDVDRQTDFKKLFDRAPNQE